MVSNHSRLALLRLSHRIPNDFTSVITTLLVLGVLFYDSGDTGSHHLISLVHLLLTGLGFQHCTVS